MHRTLHLLFRHLILKLILIFATYSIIRDLRVFNSLNDMFEEL